MRYLAVDNAVNDFPVVNCDSSDLQFIILLEAFSAHGVPLESTEFMSTIHEPISEIDGIVHVSDGPDRMLALLLTAMIRPELARFLKLSPSGETVGRSRS